MGTERGHQHLFDACAYCGEQFETDVRYPVTTCEGPDGDLELHSFCSEDCQIAWISEHADTIQ